MGVMILKYTIIAISAAALLVLTACEGKKSLDGHPMDKPPPSAFAPRDSEPVFVEPVAEEEGDVEEVVVNDVDEAEAEAEAEADADADEAEAVEDEAEPEEDEDEADADEE